MPSFRTCPECSERLSADARQCACGWKEGKGVDPFHGKCAWKDGVDRCRFPGSISHGQRGEPPWYCAFHFFDTGAEHGARIVKSSFDWDGNPATYHAMRVAHQNRARVGERSGIEGISEIPIAIRELVSRIRMAA